MRVTRVRQIVLSCLLILVMALTLAACGDNSQTPTQPVSPMPTQPVSPTQPPSPVAPRPGG